MTAKQKQKARNASNLAAYHRQMVDPAFREARAAKERARWARGEGARRNALDRERTRTVQAYRAANPRPPKPATKEQLEGDARVAAKRAWWRAHAAELNARRQAARLADPEKYRRQEKESKQRKRALLRQIEETSETASKLLPTDPQ